MLLILVALVLVVELVVLLHVLCFVRPHRCTSKNREEPCFGTAQKLVPKNEDKNWDKIMGLQF